MHISPCATHYYRGGYEGLDRTALLAQQLALEEALSALEEQRAEVKGLSGRHATKLLATLNRETLALQTRLAAVAELIEERGGI